MVYKYAKTVVNQADQRYVGVRNDWANPQNAIGGVDKTYASASYTKSKSTYKKPHVLSCYDFGMEIPDNAVITGIKFQVKIKASVKKKITAPLGRFLDFHTNYKDTSDGTKTGWKNKAYIRSIDSKLSGNWQILDYDITDKDIKILNKYSDYDSPATLVMKEHFGIMLDCRDANVEGELQVAWVRLVVDYELPKPYVKYSPSCIDEGNPAVANVGEEFKLTVEFGNKSTVASLPNQLLMVDIPYGLELVRYELKDKSISYNSDWDWWEVSGEKNAKNTLILYLVPHVTQKRVISVGNEIVGFTKGYFHVFGNAPEDYGEGYIEHTGLQKGEKSCVSGYMQWTSLDEIANPFMQLGHDNLTENDIISVEISSNHEDVYLIDYTLQDNKVLFNIHVPSRVDVDIATHVCYYPRSTGEITLAIPNYQKQAFVEEPIHKILKLATDNQGNCTNVWQLETNRFMTNIDTDLTVIPLRFDSFCQDLYLDTPTLTLDQWKKKSYIGCVETEHSHYDPESTFEDDLLNEHYKNMQYIGKANEYDEEISLNIKLRPWQVPTIQGLIKIDRPIPINLVPNAFEGDPLNHRGWVEITKIKSKKTNPLWYDCDIDVKYITHNIISRFNIIRGSTVNKYSLPNVYSLSLDSGDDIGEFFDIETDGGFVYDEEEEEFTRRNLFSIDNGQSIILTSKNVLNSKSSIDLYWDTMLYQELAENNISRVVQLIDEYDNVVFEYEYFDFEFTDTTFTCRVQARKTSENGYDIPIDNEVYIHSNVEHTDDQKDEDYDEYDIDTYGTQTIFELDSNRITVKELGFSGSELEETFDIEAGNYKLRIEFKNNNNDAETGNILNWIDCTVNEMAFNSNISQYYDRLVVSPYPVPYKEIVFTRESEEGTIYYFKDDNGDFDFLLEPFYQYLCGVDLRSSDGIQLFDFNNSYPVIYMVNGLIRFGINRINGDLYLDKWDTQSGGYIRTNRFRITKFDDVEVVTLNDDIITLKISDIYVTMWRGRPYVEINHETEDLMFLDRFNMAFADGVNDETYSIPQYFQLINYKNKFPECIGGTKLIKSSCMELTIEESNLNDSEFIITPNKQTGYVGEEIILTINGITANDGEVSLIINDTVVATNVGQQITAELSVEGQNNIYAVYHGTETTNMSISNEIIMGVSEKDADDTYEFVAVTPNLPNTASNKYYYGQGTFDFQLYENHEDLVVDVPVDVYTPAQTWHLTTGIDGQVHAKNNNIPAGTHTIYATAIDPDRNINLKASMKITVVESTPKIIGSSLTFVRGGRAKFKLVNESNEPIENVNLSINLSGMKFLRTTVVDDTNVRGVASIKISKKGYYTAKVKYAGKKGRYKAVSKTFNIEVK